MEKKFDQLVRPLAVDLDAAHYGNNKTVTIISHNYTGTLEWSDKSRRSPIPEENFELLIVSNSNEASAIEHYPR